MTKRNFTRLTRAIDHRNCEWLADVEPEIYAALEAELADGATPDEVAQAVTVLSSEKFGRVVLSAARWLSGGNA
jgi:hypothetical protein